MPNLRPATKAEIPAIIAILHSAFWSNFNRLEPGAWDDVSYRDDVRVRHEREVLDFWPEITIAEINGVPGGWGARFAGKNEIAEMWVHADFQGKGAGSALIRKFTDDIKDEGHPDAWIETHRRNVGAIRLYQRMGFVIDHEKTHFSKGLVRDIPLVRMRLGLP